MKKLLPILMLLAMFAIPHEAKAYCFTYSKTANFTTTTPGWNNWGNFVQPGSFILAPSRPQGFGWMHFARLEGPDRFAILERTFKFAEVDNVVVTSGLGGCPPSHLPPDPVLNKVKAVQGTAWITQASGEANLHFQIQIINPTTFQYLAIRDFPYSSQPSGSFRISTGLVITTLPNVLLRVVLVGTGFSEDLLVRDARVDYYTN